MIDHYVLLANNLKVFKELSDIPIINLTFLFMSIRFLNNYNYKKLKITHRSRISISSYLILIVNKSYMN